MAESDQEVGNKASEDTKNAQTTSEDDTRSIAVADSPTDEVGVCLLAKRKFDIRHDALECGWVGGVLESVEHRLLLPRGQVEFTGGTLGEVDADDARDLVTVRLCSN